MNKPMSQREVELTNLLAHVMDEKGELMRENERLRKQLELLGYIEWKTPEYPNKDSDNG